MTRQQTAEALDRLAPRIPQFERDAIIDHAVDSAALRQAAPEERAWLSMVAFVRHRFTDYDAMLDEGYDVESARHAVADDMRDVLQAWGVRRSL